MLRTGRVTNVAFGGGGGSGGRVTKHNWDGTLVFDYQFSNDSLHQHHDIEPLPNGNFLVLLWDLRDEPTAQSLGRIPNQTPSGGVWAEAIWEIEPVDETDYNVVWKWSAWDHLVQNQSDALPNFGDPTDFPNRIDVNYRAQGGGQQPSDWLHFNSIAYDPLRDEIITSSRFWDEIWVIDHNTTTQEAAGTAGDILYRWGNPEAYGRGDTGSVALFGQHDARVIPPGLPNAGKISVFSNGNGRPGGNTSSVDLLVPPLDANGNYVQPAAGAAFGPDAAEFAYPPGNFFAQRISGAHQLPNGNFLITEGPAGRIFESDPAFNTVWEYINPVGNDGPVEQGTAITANSVFRATRYAPDYPAFAGRDLTPSAPLELNPLPGDCSIVSASNPPELPDARVFPNPVGAELTVRFAQPHTGQIRIQNTLGQIIERKRLNGSELRFATNHWTPGWYLVTFNGQVVARVVK